MNELQVKRKSLKKILLVNWSKFGAVQMKINGSTLFTGVNGSGKSTILDAMTYLIAGNTQFNKAAQDQDRTVLGYVRGDTKNRGSYRFLRSGAIVSYIAMEFDSPSDRSSFVVGVCIESQDEKSFKSWWFVKDRSSIEDFNFYQKEGTQLSVTPHHLLYCKQEKLKSQEFMPKEKGVQQVMRMLGLRYDREKYRTKLMKMIVFKQESHIDHFIRDSVLPEHKITTIPQLQEQKAKYEELRIVYDRLREQKNQLEQIDRATLEFEGAQKNVFLKWLVFYYQSSQMAERDASLLRTCYEQTVQQLKRLKEAETAAKEMFDQAAKAKADAQRQYDDNDLNGTIRSLSEQIESLEKQIRDCQDKVNEIRSLQNQIVKLCAKKELGIIPTDSVTATAFCSPEVSVDEKYAVLYDLQRQVENKKEYFQHMLWELDRTKKKTEGKLSETTKAIRGLEHHQRSYPDDVENARKLLQSELAKQGMTVEVRTFAELVESITLPEWRDALETYLGNQRYHLILEPAYIKAAMRIFHYHHIKGVELVLTDKLPDKNANQGSAAEILSVPNPYARKYANYLLGRLHLCNTLDELHEHPQGGIMVDGTLAKGYTMRSLNLEGVHYYLGADAIALEIEVKRREQKQYQDQIQEIRQQMEDSKHCFDQLSAFSLESSRYDFKAVKSLPKLHIRLTKSRADLDEMKNDPTFLILSEALERAEKAYQAADKAREAAIRSTAKCQGELSEFEKKIPEADTRAQETQKIYHAYALQHLELKREAIAEYEKLSVKRADGVVITEKYIRSNLEADLDKIRKKMESAQLEYCRLAGLDMERHGDTFIGYFREELEKISNVQIEEASAKMADAQKRLESAFMNECVSELIEAIKNARDEIDAINRELHGLPFGNSIYSFTASERSDKAAFFRIMKRVNSQSFGAEAYLAANADDLELEQDIQEFMERILEDCDDAEFTDYRNYLHYDMEIQSRTDAQEISALSEKQGSASNGEKQTPYFIILAASLMQCYPRNACCARLAFIDEAFSALSSERIEKMVHYFEQNGFQVMYAAPPEKINSIGSYIDSTISLIESRRYTFAVEGLADEFAGTQAQQHTEEDTQLAFAAV